MSSSFNGVLCNAFIDKVLEHYCKYFHGVYSSNTIPQDLKKKTFFCVVVNLSRDDEPGSHFVSVIKNKETLFYLDSLLLDAKKEILHSVISEDIISIKMLSERIQSVQSNFCGFYCILFCLLYEEIVKYSRLPNFYVDEYNLTKNDKLCLQYIVNCMKLSE